MKSQTNQKGNEHECVNSILDCSDNYNVIIVLTIFLQNEKSF